MAKNKEDKEVENFESLHKEWREYHEGKVVHPMTDEEVSKAELRLFEISDLVEKEFDKLKKKFPRGRPKFEDIEPHVYELAEKSYLAQQGVKSKKDLDPDILKQNVQAYFVNMASQVADESFDTYEEAVQSILEASNPIHGKSEAELSPILSQLLQQYSTLTHKSEHKDTKGHRARRLEYLRRELSNKKHKDRLLKEYGGIFDEYGRSGHKFDDSAKSGHILSVAEHALSNQKISGTLLRRRYIKNPPGPLKEAKPAYKAT